MHRMVNYIMDLRNMTIAMTILGAFGLFLFIILKYIQRRQIRKYRRPRCHTVLLYFDSNLTTDLLIYLRNMQIGLINPLFDYFCNENNFEIFLKITNYFRSSHFG